MSEGLDIVPSDLNSKLGIAVPTCSFNDIMYGPNRNEENPTNSWLTTICSPAMDVLKSRAVLLLCFNPPYEQSQIDTVVTTLEDCGWEVRWTFLADVGGRPPNMVKLRNTAADLGKDCDFFLLSDDDMIFVNGTNKFDISSGQKYLEAMHYMEANPDCGLVQCKSFLGGYHQQGDIVPIWKHMYRTGEGLIVRNLPDTEWTLSPDYNLVGALEETFIVYHRLSKGYFPAKQMNCPTIHRGPQAGGDVPSDSMHSQSVIDANIHKWVQDKWDSNWDFQSRNLPNHVDFNSGEVNSQKAKRIKYNPRRVD